MASDVEAMGGLLSMLRTSPGSLVTGRYRPAAAMGVVSSGVAEAVEAVRTPKPASRRATGTVG